MPLRSDRRARSLIGWLARKREMGLPFQNGKVGQLMMKVLLIARKLFVDIVEITCIPEGRSSL